MPRNGRTPSRNPRHHAAMASAAHGKGRDAKFRLKKRQDGREHCDYCKKPVKKRKPDAPLQNTVR